MASYNFFSIADTRNSMSTIKYRSSIYEKMLTDERFFLFHISFSDILPSQTLAKANLSCRLHIALRAEIYM
jgi:hypothetical protein